MLPTLPAEVLVKLDKQVIRQPKNPLDRCTIVSLLPKLIDERNVTVSPGRWVIEPAPENGFSILVVGSSSWFKETEPNQPYLEIPHSSIQMADSIINGYMNGLVGCNMGDTKPGLFFLPGEYTKETIVKVPEFAVKLLQAREQQRRWYAKLVQIADEGWSATNGNPLSISNDARYGAKLLQLERPWLRDFQAIELSPCKACGELTNPAYPVCRHCKAISNPELAKKLNLEFAK